MTNALSFKELDLITKINPDFKPRYYQQQAVNAVLEYEGYADGGNPLLVVPTGAGKSHILGMLCKTVLEAWPDQKILIVSHVDTILQQDYLAVREHLPPAKVGIFSAGVGRKEKCAVTVAGIQSVYSKAHLFKSTTLILVDEAHSIPIKGNGQYRTFLKNFTCPVVGLTATHFRLGAGYLHEGEDRLFTDVAYEVDIQRLIDEGYLCNLVVPSDLAVTIDMQGVKTQAGDFSKKQTLERIDREGVTEGILEDLITYKERYKQWLIFAIDIEHAELVAASLSNEGIPTAVVHSKQAKSLNEALKLDFKNKRYQALVSVESLTTGFDVPSVDLIALLRPTNSPVLHVQMIGRGLRIHPEKEHCVVLDYAGNVARLGPINDVHIPGKKKGTGKGAPIEKVCPNCGTICAGVVKICPTCDMIFLFTEKLQDEVSNKDVIAKKKKKKKEKKNANIEPVWQEVTSVWYEAYVGKAGLSMLVSYRCGLRTFFEYKKFDSGTKAGYHAQHWWKGRSHDPNMAPPESTQEAINLALTGILKTPYAILVLERGKYPEIQQALCQ